MSNDINYTPEEDQAIIDAWGIKSSKDLSNDLDRSISSIKRRRAKLKESNPDLFLRKGLSNQHAPKTNSRTIDTTKNGVCHTFDSKTVRTVEDALKECQVDLDVWEVERCLIGKWDSAAKTDETVNVSELWQVKLWLKRKTGISQLKAYKELLEEMKKYSPKYTAFKPKVSKDSSHVMVVSITDMHLGKYAEEEETGDAYDIGVAKKRYLEANRSFLDRGSHWGVEQIVMVLSGDTLHTDGMISSTTSGTPQDSDGKWQKSFCEARKTIIEAIDEASTLAPVKLVMLPGNHDFQRSFYLGDTISSWYKSHDGVEIDNRPRTRKYHQYGVNMLGFTHGNEESPGSLPLIMAEEEPAMWAATQHREWLTGHLHKKKQVKYVGVDTYGGVSVRILPSISSADAWHAKRGYSTGNPSAEAYLYHKVNRYSGHLSWSFF